MADGWAEDKEKDNTCVLLLKDGLYYLAIMDKKHNNLFLEENTTPEGLNKQLKFQEQEESKNLDALTKRKEGTKGYINLQKKIQDIKDEQSRLRHIFSLISRKESPYQKMIYKYFKDGVIMIPKCSTQRNEVKEHFINNSKEEDYILKGKGFQTDLIITKEIFKLNNYVFDEKELKFVLKKDKDDKRPKKFQKDYAKLLDDQCVKLLEDQKNCVKLLDDQKDYAKLLDDQKDYQKDYQKALDQWIKFCERFLKSYQSTVGFDYGELFKKSYNSLDAFYNSLNHCIYKINFQDISSEYIKSCMEEGKLYLFQIYSKDFSPKSKGKPNLQTLYWKALFDEKKMNEDKKELGVYKLNGQAELFYRKKSIEYSEERWMKGHHFNEPKKKQHYPIIKDRRYAKDTFLFHVSITCNFKASNINRFNDKVNGFLKNNSDIHIIGIDRGERHLAYYALINQRGEILEQESLNTIVSQHKKDGKNIEKEKNYHSLLDKREKERNEARKSWGTIEKIKDLKAGYLSQVVHKIVTLMIKYNAIIVFEDLNFGFKRGRFKVEKQVYQKLEKMLIDKLNYLVLNKEEGSHDVGGTFNALQLTAPFKSFKKIDKQTGFIFYVPAYHTSKICPATGFVNLLYPRYETLEKIKNFFGKFDKIYFNKKQDYFEFHFNYKKFTDKAEGSQQDWVIYSHGGRLENVKENNKWETRKEEVELTKEFKELFRNKIVFEDGQCLKSIIDQQEDRKFFKNLIRLLKLTLQMRNSRINDDEDWLISPVKDKHGNFFNSRNQNEKMPKNTDANGAYHIALKGLLMLKQLNEGEDHQNFKPDLSNKEWYQFVQKKNKT